MPEITSRRIDEAAQARLAAAGCDPRLARLFAARGVSDPGELGTSLAGLHAPEGLARIGEAAVLLADAIAAREPMLVVADYDADGATACAVAVKGLRAMGATVDYLVPNRFAHAYGISPEIVAEAAKRSPRLLITVDNGIAAVEGIEAANSLGMRVLVTDHHLPGARVPAAACIVNPNQAGCGFKSKHLAGVGVMFYVLLALRAELRSRGAFAGRDARQAAVYDLGFSAGPRLNAAGRLEDMSLGIECLLAADEGRAMQLAGRLDRLNRERREIEVDMQASAMKLLEGVEGGDGYTLSLHHPDWHGGVVGILASRLKDRFHRPVFAFARDNSGKLKGSGRSIPGFHLRDALDRVDKGEPGLLERFGGHAAAAGVTLEASKLEAFRAAFEAVAREWLSPADLLQRVETDGELDGRDLTYDFARLLREHVWGQGFPEPRFEGRFEVLAQKVVGEKHLKLGLGLGGRRYDAIRFNSADPLPASIRAVYRLDVNEYQGSRSLQLVLEHLVD